jgi:hypothetical protein
LAGAFDEGRSEEGLEVVVVAAQAARTQHLRDRRLLSHLTRRLVSNSARAAATVVPASTASCSAAERNHRRFHMPDSSTRGANNIAMDSANRAARTAAARIVDTSHNATAAGSNSAASSRNANSISSR